MWVSFHLFHKERNSSIMEECGRPTDPSITLGPEKPEQKQQQKKVDKNTIGDDGSQNTALHQPQPQSHPIFQLPFREWNSWEFTRLTESETFRVFYFSSSSSYYISLHCTFQMLPPGMWNLRRPGIKPVSPVLANGFLTLTSGPPGKSLKDLNRHVRQDTHDTGLNLKDLKKQTKDLKKQMT